MTKLQEALEKIHKDWSKLEHGIKDGHKAVWIAVSDTAGSYEVDEEWIGMKGDGSLVWAYASGCSCWAGDYDSDLIKEVKVFEFKHEQMSKGWQDAIIKFADTYKTVEL